MNRKLAIPELLKLMDEFHAEFKNGGWDEITYHECVKPIRTNADRIRSMSDVELAEFLEKVELGEFWADIPWLEWLKQEVE